ncbi:MAG: hypothetical protein L6300_13500, partial [Syntrophaceae bacterium]|nr:hypothetical protein [Pseudomonadota bacterium]MCG2741230.1 hypothetical protein [Syntrophaceae bacterium]
EDETLLAAADEKGTYADRADWGQKVLHVHPPKRSLNISTFTREMFSKSLILAVGAGETDEAFQQNLKSLYRKRDIEQFHIGRQLRGTARYLNF